MDRSTRSIILFLFWFIIIALQILPTIGDGGQHYAQNQEEQKPSIAEIVTNGISLLKQSHEFYWNTIKAIYKEVQLQLSPPNLEWVYWFHRHPIVYFHHTIFYFWFSFKGRDEGNPEDGVGGNNAVGKMKEAVEKSFGTSKHTVEESAKSAANVVGEAMHKTEEKVKESIISDKDESDAEL
jgi:superoxide dismutase